ncbi:MAG: TrkA family potassium uptake protein [Candidatus Omnitrophica bacterium]|nr:TrkA family potassium uptake protein [Candidatus Omnitrophota bacterium]
MSKKFVVIGLGILGRNLASILASRGAEVIAIDSEMTQVEEIKDRVTYAVAMDATNEKALKAQDIADVDAAVVCIGENFQANLLTTVLLKKMGVKMVIARASNPIERQILTELGADELIYPEEDLARELSVRLMADSILDMFPLSAGLGAARLKAPQPFWNKSLMELNLRAEYGINIIAIYDPEQMEKTHDPFPVPTDVIKEGDVLMVVGRREAIEKLAQMA